MTKHIGATVIALNTVLLIISSIVVASGLLIGLILIDWQVALSTAGLFGIAYVLVGIVSRRQLRANGVRMAAANKERVQALQEGLGAIRDVCLMAASLTTWSSIAVLIILSDKLKQETYFYLYSRDTHLRP